MLVEGFPAGGWQTNCYVVAPAAGEECVVVDPGQDAFDRVQELVRRHRLRPVAVLLTHGHVDHVWSVVPVCAEHAVPAWIHPDDRYMLTDPGRAVGLPSGSPVFGGMTFAEPDDVRELSDGGVIELAGLSITVDLAPGHTPGSITFRTAGQEAEPPVLWSGDLLFAGSIGRTDFPGGSTAAIMDSLARVCLPLDDETVVLSGHGPATTIGRERVSNPYLLEAAAAAGSAAQPPRRGL